MANSLLRIEQCHQESCDQVNSVSEMTVQRLLLELETGGNVRFEDGKPSDPWYKSCHDLVLSRFCVGDYQVYSFSFRLESALSGSLSDDDGDGNENGKKEIGLIRKTTTYTFCCCRTSSWNVLMSRFVKVRQVSKRTRWVEILGAFISVDFYTVRKRNYSLETTTSSWLP